MLPKETSSSSSSPSVTECPDGFEEIDEDDIIEVMRKSEKREEVLVALPPDDEESQPRFLPLDVVTPQSNLPQEIENWCPTYDELFNDCMFEDVIEEVVALDAEEEDKTESAECLSDASSKRSVENIREKNANKLEVLVKRSSIENLEDSNNDVENKCKKSFSETSSTNQIDFLTIYPPPPAKGGITINTEDYNCLNRDTFLNDVIIDFYLKYLWLEVLSPDDRRRTHIFSSHFFTRLSKPYEENQYDNAVSKDKRRHIGVQRWTKNVNIFEKDFVIVPINEYYHWFLAIICFPNLIGAIGTLLTDCFTSEHELQRPCLLIFDSLGGTNKGHVAKILKSYLHYEYLAKMNDNKNFANEVLPTIYVKVPRQINATDCGLYVLQYVEHFFKNPIQDFTLPFKNLSQWFKLDVIRRKREEIANLIVKLINNFSKEKSVNLPKLTLLTDNEIFSLVEEDNSQNTSSSSESQVKSISLLSSNLSKKPKVSLFTKNQFDVSSRIPSFWADRKLCADKSTVTDSESDSSLIIECKNYATNNTSSLFEQQVKSILPRSNNASEEPKKPVYLLNRLLHPDKSKSTDFKSNTTHTSIIDGANYVSDISVADQYRVSDIETNCTRSKRPVRKAVLRATKLKETTKWLKERRQLKEDSEFHKKDGTKRFDLLKPKSTLESSPWLSKEYEKSKDAADRFYNYSIKNERSTPSFKNLGRICKFKEIKEIDDCSDSS